MSVQRYPPVLPPAWASAWGDDPYGLWAEFTVGDVVQRMRWIEPGKFLMGSPDSESERRKIEGPQHEVTISKGFWLADTACTQALWQAVLPHNPIQFDVDPTLPVESVSWNDVQRFLVELESQRPMSSPCLPTEAQWEFACRAGTITPFSFGDRITRSEVNYDDDHPDSGVVKAKYGERAVPVKSLPPNAWGLFEMHGNVMEWCADGPREYDNNHHLDPFGPDGPDTYRVLRGGSWSLEAKLARSAHRVSYGPSVSFTNNVGFRLSLRPGQPSKPGGAGEAQTLFSAKRPPA